MTSECGDSVDVEFDETVQTATLIEDIASDMELYYLDDMNLYFEEKNSNVDIYEILENSSSLSLQEFRAIKVSGYNPGMNNVEMYIEHFTPSDEYAILVGIAEDANNVTWYGFKGIEIDDYHINAEIPSNLMTLLNNSDKNVIVGLILGAE